MNAEMAIDAEVIESSDTGLQRTNAGALAVSDFSWTPETLRAQIDNETQLRKILVDYMQAAMQPGHHYYRIDGKDDTKPALSKEGAYNLCSIFKVIALDPEVFETWHGDPFGHYTVRTRTRLVDRSGAVIAVGDGLATTKESKWAYRKGSRVCPECETVGTVIKGKAEYGGGWLCWTNKGGCGAKWKDGDKAIEGQDVGRVPNENLPDLYNTVLKISGKRSFVDAVLKLPLVSELFGQDVDEAHIREALGVKDDSTAAGEDAEAAPRGKNKPQATAAKAGSTPAKGKQASKPSEKAQKPAQDQKGPDILEKYPEKAAELRRVIKTWNASKYEPKWDQAYMTSYINPMFEVSNGIESLTTEAQLDALIEDLNMQLEERQAMVNEQVY